MNYGLRYTKDSDEYETNYQSWKPECTSMTQFLCIDRKDFEYGTNLHQFIPKDYVVTI